MVKKMIGGFFPTEVLPKEENHFFDTFLNPADELLFLMSGRCGILCALEDIKLRDTKKVAYVPAYTCGTVLAPYVKAGYKLLFYDVSKSMTPLFDDAVLDKISVINLCGYYGFCRYDRSFIKKCKDRKITIIEDTTHSILSNNGIDPLADYIVGSFRKWIGVYAGGFAIKRNGSFEVSLKPCRFDHLQMRMDAMDKRRKMEDDDFRSVSESEYTDAALQVRKAEMFLREIFDCYSSDKASVEIINHVPLKEHAKKRRENYSYLLEHFPYFENCYPVFKDLDEDSVPSHFTIFTDKRDDLKEFLAENNISATAYWAKGVNHDTTNAPEAEFIFNHVLSLPCDQRYSTHDIDEICHAVEDFWNSMK